MINDNKIDVLGDFDFSRTDKFFNLRVPSYIIDAGVVFYEMNLKDLTNGDIFVSKYRFKDLKNLH